MVINNETFAKKGAYGSFSRTTRRSSKQTASYTPASLGGKQIPGKGVSVKATLKRNRKQTNPLGLWVQGKGGCDGEPWRVYFETGLGRLQDEIQMSSSTFKKFLC